MRAVAAPGSRNENPWWIVLGSFTGLTVSLGAVGACIGLYLPSLQTEFGWDRATVSGSQALSSLVAAGGLTIAGWMMDRWGIRRVVAIAVFAFGLSVGMMSLIRSLASLLAFSFCIGLAGAAHTPVGSVKSICSYIDGRRGLASGIAVAGVGVGTAAMPLYAGWLIQHFGWRAGFVGLGALIWLVGLPSVLLFLRDPPVSDGDAERRDAGMLPGLSAGEAVRTRSFWTLACAVLMIATTTNGSLIHLGPMLSDHLRGTGAGAAGLATAGLATVFGRFFIGWLFDRWFAPRVVAPVLILAAGALFLIKTGVFPLLGAAAIGLAMGAELDMIGYLTSRYFGVRKQGQLSGFLYGLAALGLGAGQYGYGVLFTRYGSYDIAYLVAAGLLTTAAGLVLTLGPYRYAPVRRQPSDVTAPANSPAICESV